MVPLLAFGGVLLLAVLLSGLASRSVLSTAVLFLLAGFVAGEDVLGLVHVRTGDPAMSRTIEVALFTVLFTDGMKAGLGDLRRAWRLPGRALLVGLPLTLLATAALARALAGLPWIHALLLGAVLSPTDPVFASAIVGKRAVPARLRHLLNVESGLNDGLALPFVTAFLMMAGGHDVHVLEIAGEVAAGVVLGLAVAWLAVRLEASRFFGVAPLYQPLSAVAVALIVFAAASLLGANDFLAAFFAGATLASTSRETCDAFRPIGEALSELLKLASLFVLGALISPTVLAGFGAGEYAFGALALFVVRPALFSLLLLRTPLGGRERAAAAWFGPRGFASVFFALLVLRAGMPHGEAVFHLAALVIAASIVAHSSTDVLVARWFETEPGDARAAHRARPQPAHRTGS
jgi:NhaP-type Na+/H+ or K+/H+ antiporter